MFDFSFKSLVMLSLRLARGILLMLWALLYSNRSVFLILAVACAFLRALENYFVCGARVSFVGRSCEGIESQKQAVNDLECSKDCFNG